MNDSDAITILYNLFESEFCEASDTDINWRVRNSSKQIDESIVSMILHDICGKIEAKRHPLNPSIGLVFEDEIGIELLIKMSGGNKRILYRLLRDLFSRVEHLPVTERNTNRIISEARNVAHRTVDEKDWELLAKVYLNPLAPYDLAAEYQNLIRSQSMLYYTWFPCYWLVNPLIEKLHPFQEALQKIQQRKGAIG